MPIDEQAQTFVLEPGSYASMTEELRDHDRVVRDLPEPARAAVAAYDPTGEAVWLLGPFVVDEPLLGRPVYGGRPAAWLALEDKLLAEGLWRAVGAAHAPAAVVPVTADALAAASDRLDLGHGVVWAGDARDGFNGGGDFTRWVVTAADRADALRFFTPRCDRVRVMPFLEGVPCSIHGIVLPDGTAAFRPVELAIMRGVGRRFVYGGQGSTWDPPGVDRLAMRELARRTGEHLRERVGYRGGFGIDGVLTVDGFRPTELNTRASAGLSTLGQTADDEAFTLLDKACVVGRDPGVRRRPRVVGAAGHGRPPGRQGDDDLPATAHRGQRRPAGRVGRQSAHAVPVGRGARRRQCRPHRRRHLRPGRRRPARAGRPARAAERGSAGLPGRRARRASVR